MLTEYEKLCNMVHFIRTFKMLLPNGTYTWADTGFKYTKVIIDNIDGVDKFKIKCESKKALRKIKLITPQTFHSILIL